MPTEQMVMEWAINDTPKPTRKIYAKLPSFDEFVHDFIGIWPRR